MSHRDQEDGFFYKDVLGKKSPAIYRRGSNLAPNLDKPEGFRIPLIYFSWGLLEGDRSIHHHPDNDEILLMLEGSAKVRLIGPGKPMGSMPRFDTTYQVSAGDIVVFPQGWAHSLEDDDPKHPARYLVIFNNQDFVSVEDEFDEEKMCLGENA